MTRPFARLSAATVRARLATFLGPGVAAPGRAARVTLTRLPAWVARAGACRAGDATLVLLEPAPADEAVPGPGGQAVFDAPAGRYIVDTFDVRRAAWIASESALAPPLVIGVPCPGGPVVLRISPVSVSASPA